jgi:hypothetical protein
VLGADGGLQLIRQQVAQTTPGCDLCCSVQVLPAQLLPRKSLLLLVMMLLSDRLAGRAKHAKQMRSREQGLL